MGFLIVYGAYFGDEGKGAVVDRLSEYASAAARYNGGCNAGHTVKVGDKEIGLHHIPSSILRSEEGVISAIGRGVVVDIDVLSHEEESIRRIFGIETDPELFWIDPFVHITLPHYKAIEAIGASKKIGTTKKGIGPTYEAKVKRDGIRFCDIDLPSNKLMDKLDANFDYRKPVLREYYNSEQIDKLYRETILTVLKAKEFKKFMRDTPNELDKLVRSGKTVIAEGAQGFLLDIDHGTYPYVTSSNPGPSGAIQSLNIDPDYIDDIIAVFKSYSTRVGSGPFIVELDNEIGDAIRKKGAEYGTTTGRPRRCGWLDLPALAYSTRQAKKLYMTKLDVLANMPVHACVAYKIDGETVEEFGSIPTEMLEEAKPVLKKFNTWRRTSTRRNGKRVLTKNAEKFVRWVEEKLDKPIMSVGIGPERDEYIEL